MKITDKNYNKLNEVVYRIDPNHLYYDPTLKEGI